MVQNRVESMMKDHPSFKTTVSRIFYRPLYNNDNNEVFECPFSMEPKTCATNIQTKRSYVPDIKNSL